MLGVGVEELFLRVCSQAWLAMGEGHENAAHFRYRSGFIIFRPIKVKM